VSTTTSKLSILQSKSIDQSSTIGVLPHYGIGISDPHDGDPHDVGAHWTASPKAWKELSSDNDWLTL
jgi:hypothetical protein